MRICFAGMLLLGLLNCLPEEMVSGALEASVEPTPPSKAALPQQEAPEPVLLQSEERTLDFSEAGRLALRVSNAGWAAGAAPVVIVEDGETAAFRVEDTMACTGAPLEAGASCELEVVFRPPAQGAYHATLVVDVGGDALRVPLTGQHLIN